MSRVTGPLHIRITPAHLVLHLVARPFAAGAGVGLGLGLVLHGMPWIAHAVRGWGL